MRDAGLVASRVVALYVGFHAMIYSGDFLHDIIRDRDSATFWSALVPLILLSGTAIILWTAAPKVAGWLVARTSTTDPPRTADRVDLAQIAFATAGLVIGAQAIPLAAHAIARVMVPPGINRDVVADFVAAAVRIGLGIGIVLSAHSMAIALLTKGDLVRRRVKEQTNEEIARPEG